MASNDTSVGQALFTLAFALFLIFFVPCRGCMVDDEAPVKAVLKTHGFSNYQIHDKDWFVVGFRGCQADEAAKFEVTATNPSGKKVDFLVCTGWPFKGGTIRSDW